jgi:ankyrin repeat protein
MSDNLPQALIDEFVGVAHGDAARVQELLAQHPALLNARASWNESALEAAAQIAQIALVEWLLAQGAPLDLCTAALLGKFEFVRERLLADPEQVNATGAHGLPLLYYAAITGRRSIGKLLLTAGADVNTGEGTMTALHGAALFGKARMTAWLLEFGASVHAKNYEGKTPLQLAEEKGHQEVADLLKRHEEKSFAKEQEHV